MLTEFSDRNINVSGVLIVYSPEFSSMRLLGNCFHIGMNGMAKASDRIFAFLICQSRNVEKKLLGAYDESYRSIICKFSYDESREVLHDISMNIDSCSLVSVFQGSGKSTIAGVLLGKNHYYSGSIKVNGTEHKKYQQSAWRAHRVGHNSWVFKG